jgi:prepilin-type processing-associated H-X9-DG protein
MQGSEFRSIGVSRSHFRRCTVAFTLVELLVVIGIIALLISILLPALSKAREQANRTACAAKLKQIVLAAQLHTYDHKGYYPLVGVIPGSEPADLDDTYQGRYDYIPSGMTPPSPPQMLAPITFALSLEFGRGNNKLLSDSSDAVQARAETDPQGFIKNFLCPSQASDVTELHQLPLLYVCGGAGDADDSGTLIGYTEAMSYNFNEAICGWQDATTTGRLQGQASKVRQPALTMFACDGLQGLAPESRVPDAPYWILPPAPTSGMAALYNISANPPVTMADALANGHQIAGDPENFDLKRHFGKINIAFCDGHVELRNISVSDLSTVFLLAP